MDETVKQAERELIRAALKWEQKGSFSGHDECNLAACIERLKAAVIERYVSDVEAGTDEK